MLGTQERKEREGKPSRYPVAVRIPKTTPRAGIVENERADKCQWNAREPIKKSTRTGPEHAQSQLQLKGAAEKNY